MKSNPIEQAKAIFLTNLDKGNVLLLSDIYHKMSLTNEEDQAFFPLIEKWYKSITELNFLPHNLSDYEEVFFHGPTKIICKGRLEKKHIETDLTNKDFQIICDLLAIKEKQNFNYATPFVSFFSELNETKVRISLSHFSTNNDNKSKAFIRILNTHTIPISYYNLDSVFLNDIIKHKKNVLIAGATGSGKTTFTNSLTSLIQKNEHIVLIEDTAELISPTPYTTNLITDKANEEKSMNSYLSYSLRMSPDRIILGEIRGKEAESSLLAMNTGHNGFISTIHSNSAKDALDRLCLLFKIYSKKDLSYSLILKLITSNIDYVFYLKDKKVVEIIEVFGSQDEKVFFESISIKKPASKSGLSSLSF